MVMLIRHGQVTLKVLESRGANKMKNILAESFRILSGRDDYSYTGVWDDEDFYTIVELERDVLGGDLMNHLSKLCVEYDYLAGCIAFCENENISDAVDVYILHNANHCHYGAKATIGAKASIEFDVLDLYWLLDEMLEQLIYCEPGYVSTKFDFNKWEF